MRSLNKVFGDLPVTIFEAMSQAARDNNAINLGQGFPDDPGPEDIRRAAADASLNGYNQYPSMMGIPELRQAISTHYGHWHKLKLDPMTEVPFKIAFTASAMMSSAWVKAVGTSPRTIETATRGAKPLTSMVCNRSR